MLCLSCQWEVLINTSFLQQNLVMCINIQKEVIRQNVSRIWQAISHHPWPPPWSRPPSSLVCFSAEASRVTTWLHPDPSVYTKKTVSSYHTSCHTLQWLPISPGGNLPTASHGLSSHILSQVCHTSFLASLLFAASTLARFPPGLFLNSPGVLLPLGLCTCCSLTWKASTLSVLPPLFLHQMQVFPQKPPSLWGFLCPSI